MKFKTLTSVLMCVFLLMTATLSVSTASAEEKPVKCPGKIKVLVEEIVPQPFNEYKLLEIPVTPANEVTIKTSMAGTVAKVMSRVNTQVSQGQVLMLLDDTAIKKELANVKAELKKWKDRLWRWEHWKKRNPQSEARAKSKIKNLEELIALKEDELKNASITAPISGILAKINVNDGDTVSPEMVICNILDIDKVKVPLEDFSNKVNDGQEVKVKMKEISSIVAGTVTADEAGKSILIANPDRKIQAGMHAMFKVLIKEHENVVVLPKDHILKDESGYYVFLVNGKYAKKSIITLASEHNNKVMVTEGLADGDEIVVKEILSSKEGTLKDEIQCVNDNKRIKIYVKHDTEKKYIKRKKKAEKTTTVTKPVPAKKEEPKKVKLKKVKKPVITGKRQRLTFSDKLRIGASASFMSMSDSNFKDVYSNLTGFNLDLSYRFSEKFDIWMAAGMASKESSIDFGEGVDIDNKAEFKTTNLSLDLRYFLFSNRSFDVFVGAGLSIYSIEDKNVLYTVSDSAVGFNLLGGAYYNITRKFGFQFIIKYNSASKDVGTITVDGQQVEPTQDLKLDNLELMIGITYDF